MDSVRCGIQGACQPLSLIWFETEALFYQHKTVIRHALLSTYLELRFSEALVVLLSLKMFLLLIMYLNKLSVWWRYFQPSQPTTFTILQSSFTAHSFLWYGPSVVFLCFFEEGLQTLLLMETLTKAGCEPGSWPSPAVSFEGPHCNKAHWLGRCRRKLVAWALPGRAIQLGPSQSSRSCCKGGGHYGNRSIPRDPRAGFPIRNHNKLSNSACGAVKKCI